MENIVCPRGTRNRPPPRSVDSRAVRRGSRRRRRILRQRRGIAARGRPQGSQAARRLAPGRPWSTVEERRDGSVALAPERTPTGYGRTWNAPPVRTTTRGKRASASNAGRSWRTLASRAASRCHPPRSSACTVAPRRSWMSASMATTRNGDSSPSCSATWWSPLVSRTSWGPRRCARSFANARPSPRRAVSRRRDPGIFRLRDGT